MGCNCKFQICIGEGHLYNITTVKSSVSRFSPFQKFPLRDPIQNTADLPCVSENLIQERKLCRIQKQNVRLGRTIESCAPLLCSSLTAAKFPPLRRLTVTLWGKLTRGTAGVRAPAPRRIQPALGQRAPGKRTLGSARQCCSAAPTLHTFTPR